MIPNDSNNCHLFSEKGKIKIFQRVNWTEVLRDLQDIVVQACEFVVASNVIIFQSLVGNFSCHLTSQFISESS